VTETFLALALRPTGCVFLCMVTSSVLCEP
jgi:hypothetical protein